MSDIVLHGYQQELKNGVYNDWHSGAKNVLAVLPTGGGKSVVVSDIILDGCHSGMSQAVIAHRNELVSQMSEHVADRGIPHRIIAADKTIRQITRSHHNKYGRSFINPSAPTAVVGVDTLRSKSRQELLIPWARQISRWVIDEAHHVVRENKWGSAVEMFPNAHGLGVTATPSRADGLGLGRHADGVFDSMVLGPNMRDLIDMGNLSEYEIVCPTNDIQMHDEDLSANGDFSPNKMREKAKKERAKIVGNIVEAYCKYAFMKSAICFATDIETAGVIAEKFNSFGIRAAALSSETPTEVREKYVKEFRDGILKILVNVDLFDEGFDVPKCDVVIMARPTASLGKYLQMVGRCLRTFLGKLYGLIIDHVSNVIRHGLPDKPRFWTLDRRERTGRGVKDPDDIPLTPCKFCSKPYERFYAACPHCGMAPPLPQPMDRTIPMVDGDLMLLDRQKLAAMRNAMVLEAPGDLGARVRDATGNGNAGAGAMNRQLEKLAAQTRLSAALAQWGAVQRAQGLTDSMAYRKFYLATGMDILSALSADRTRQDYEVMAATIEGWYSK